MTRLVTLVGCLSLIGMTAPAMAGRAAAPTGEARLAKIVGDRVAGQPVSCVQLQDLRSNQIVDGTAIVYEGLGGRLYVNRPEIGAETLRQDDILVTRSWNGELCSIDTVRLVERGSRFEHGFVGLSKFVPYDRPKPNRQQG